MQKPNQGKLEKTRIPINQLVPNPLNPRNHPQDQIQKLTASLIRFGQTKPVIARKDDLVLVAGHGIFAAAKAAGLAELDVLLWDVDEKTANAYMLADNRHGDLSTNDNDRVAAILREVDEADYAAVGFDDEEVAGIIQDLAVGTIDVEEVDVGPVDDKAWISIRCPLARQADVLQRLKAAMADFQDVEVDLGTVAVN